MINQWNHIVEMFRAHDNKQSTVAERGEIIGLTKTGLTQNVYF